MSEGFYFSKMFLKSLFDFIIIYFLLETEWPYLNRIRRPVTLLCTRGSLAFLYCFLFGRFFASLYKHHWLRWMKYLFIRIDDYLLNLSRFKDKVKAIRKVSSQTFDTRTDRTNVFFFLSLFYFLFFSGCICYI